MNRRPVTRLIQGLLHDFLRNPGNFNVHLQRGNALRSARHFEVHVAQVILISKNIAQTPGPLRLL